MKSQIFNIFLLCFILCYSLNGQSTKTPVSNTNDQEEELPVLYQFEPNYDLKRQNKRQWLATQIKALDTLDITEKKRIRMVKSLYKDYKTNQFEKTMFVNTQFEDDLE